MKNPLESSSGTHSHEQMSEGASLRVDLLRHISRDRILTAQLCLIELVAWGILYYSFSVYLPLMKPDFGWSPAVLAAGFSLALLVSGIAAPFVGTWIDHNGSRQLMVTCAAIGSIGILLWSLAHTIPLYFAAWILIGCGMAGTLYAPAFATVVRSTPRKSRNSILAITLVGALASTVVLPLCSVLGESLGWRSALGLLALILVGITVPLSSALPSESDSSVKQEKVVIKPVSSSNTPVSFRILVIALMFADTAGVAFNAHLIVFLVAQGQPAYAAAGIAGLAGIAKIGGRLATAAGGQFSALALLRFSLFIKAAALSVPLLWPATWSVVAMVVGFGATSGARTVLRPAIIVEMYGSKRFGKSYGLLQLCTTIAKAAGPVGLGVLLGFTGWSWSWMFLVFLVVMSGILLFWVRPPL